MKLKIKLDRNRNNCYITLPQSFLKDQIIELDYSKKKICQPIEVRAIIGEKEKKLYLGINDL